MFVVLFFIVCVLCLFLNFFIVCFFIVFVFVLFFVLCLFLKIVVMYFFVAFRIVARGAFFFVGCGVFVVVCSVCMWFDNFVIFFVNVVECCLFFL